MKDVGVVVEGLVVSYRTGFRRLEVLKGVNLSAESGTITAIVGPNGAGKTTLFSVILGLLCPDRGECVVGGLRPSDYRRRHGVGYLPELSAFPRGWTVRALLARVLCYAAAWVAIGALGIRRAFSCSARVRVT